MGKGENASNQYLHVFLQVLKKSFNLFFSIINPLPDTPTLGSSHSAANKDMMS